ncbi:unnamed protein product [Lepidochelys olivacea]
MDTYCLLGHSLSSPSPTSCFLLRISPAPVTPPAAGDTARTWVQPHRLCRGHPGRSGSQDAARWPGSLEMQACGVGSCLLATLSLVLLCMALSTDYWLVAYGPRATAHSGLWQVCVVNECRSPDHITGYIQATRAFLILATLATAASVLFLLVSLTSCLHSPVSTYLLAAITGFAAGSCTLIAMGVFSGESWHKNPDRMIQLTFEWSFYLGWAALPLLGLGGAFALVAHKRHSGYESV